MVITKLSDYCPNYNTTVGIPYTGWKHVFSCIDPGFWLAFGMAIAISFSVLGAGFGILNVASSLSGCMIKTPRI